MARNQTTLSIAPPKPFHFADTAYSHGWVVLAPNSWDRNGQLMQRVHQLSTGRVVLLRIRGAGSASAPEIVVSIRHDGDLSSAEQHEVRDTVAHMFRLDEDLADFYALCAERGGQWSDIARGRGRLLRSPTVFEDVVKTICTTNIQWGGTKRMVQELVDTFGAPYPGDATRRAFPTPDALASVPRDAFVDRVNLGYRGPYVHELAQRLMNGELDLTALLDTDRSTPALKKELLTIKGVGNYAAATLLMLLGSYDELAVDSVFRQFVSERYFDGEFPSDAAAKTVYDDWGEWKYLAYWFDLFQASADSSS